MLLCVAIGYVERVSSVGREISDEEGGKSLTPSSVGFGLDAFNFDLTSVLATSLTLGFSG